VGSPGRGPQSPVAAAADVARPGLLHSAVSLIGRLFSAALSPLDTIIGAGQPAPPSPTVRAPLRGCRTTLRSLRRRCLPLHVSPRVGIVLHEHFCRAQCAAVLTWRPGRCARGNSFDDVWGRVSARPCTRSRGRAPAVDTALLPCFVVVLRRVWPRCVLELLPKCALRDGACAAS
jgi:hypothetical protein